MPIERLILPGRGSFWKSSLRLRIGSPPNGSTCANIVMGSPLCGERRLDGALHRLGRIVGGVPLDHLAVLADEELGEVPLDRLRAEDARCFGGEPLPDRRSLGAVDVDLAHHGKRDAVVQLAERRDLVVRPRVLGAELVARKADDDETAVAVRLPELFEACELRREAALARG